ncbi:MAG: SRPBCC domain-containing protein [Microbacteriaceae bacterium]
MSQRVAISPDVIFVIYIRATRERLWDELTSTDTPRSWMYGSETRSNWEVGARYDQLSDNFVLITGEVLVFDAPTHLRLTFDPRWDDAVTTEQPGLLDYTLENVVGDESTTKLTVVVSELSGESRVCAQRDTPEIYSSLKSLLETGRPL